MYANPILSGSIPVAPPKNSNGDGSHRKQVIENDFPVSSKNLLNVFISSIHPI